MKINHSLLVFNTNFQIAVFHFPVIYAEQKNKEPRIYFNFTFSSIILFYSKFLHYFHNCKSIFDSHQGIYLTVWNISNSLYQLILDCEGFHNNICWAAQTIEICFLTFREAKVHDQGVSRFSFCWGLFPWLVDDCHLLALSSRGSSSVHAYLPCMSRSPLL